MTQERLPEWPKQCARCEFWGDPYEWVNNPNDPDYGTCSKGMKKGDDITINLYTYSTADKTHWAFNCKQFMGEVVPF